MNPEAYTTISIKNKLYQEIEKTRRLNPTFVSASDFVRQAIREFIQKTIEETR